MFVCSYDHARAHQRSAVINKTVDCGSEMLPHLPFFMDLTPSGSYHIISYHIFRKTSIKWVFSDPRHFT